MEVVTRAVSCHRLNQHQSSLCRSSSTTMISTTTKILIRFIVIYVQYINRCVHAFDHTFLTSSSLASSLLTDSAPKSRSSQETSNRKSEGVKTTTHIHANESGHPPAIHSAPLWHQPFLGPPAEVDSMTAMESIKKLAEKRPPVKTARSSKHSGVRCHTLNLTNKRCKEKRNSTDSKVYTKFNDACCQDSG